MPKILISSIKDHELLACYITEKDNLAINEGQVKGDIFVPTPNLQRSGKLETSVIRFGSRTLSQMQIAGKKWANDLKKLYIGLVQVSASSVREVEFLDIEHTPRKKWEPLHSDIVDWFPEAPRHRIQAELVARKSAFLKI